MAVSDTKRAGERERDLCVRESESDADYLDVEPQVLHLDGSLEPEALMPQVPRS